MSVGVSTHAFHDAASMAAFALAGQASMTLQSEKTGAHFSYQIDKPKANGKDPVWFVKVKTTHDYEYLGMIGSRRDFRRTAKSLVPETAPSHLAFAFFWSHVTAGKEPPHMVVRHDGICGRCRRPLTDPESTDSGFGPECLKKMGLKPDSKRKKNAAGIPATLFGRKAAK